jgi:hypothetical protein
MLQQLLPGEWRAGFEISASGFAYHEIPVLTRQSIRRSDDFQITFRENFTRRDISLQVN